MLLFSCSTLQPEEVELYLPILWMNTILFLQEAVSFNIMAR